MGGGPEGKSRDKKLERTKPEGGMEPGPSRFMLLQCYLGLQGP